MTTVILDGNNLAARSWHAARGSMSVDGIETGSLHLFVRSLSRYLRDLRPDRFVVCWDSGRSHYRHCLYPQYKEARRKGKPQAGHEEFRPAFQLIAHFLHCALIPQWDTGGVEADDLIAEAVLPLVDTEEDVWILSSDKDLLQLLLRDGIKQLRFSTGAALTDVWTRERIVADLGYTPEQIPLVMALTGDTSDSIPGAKGIGPVKAKKLLEAHDWDLEKAAATLPDAEMVRLSYKLVKLGLAEVAPMARNQGWTVPEYDPLRLHHNEGYWQRMTDFCTQYQLRVLWDELASESLW